MGLRDPDHGQQGKANLAKYHQRLPLTELKAG
jgi:hypothetical protein